MKHKLWIVLSVLVLLVACSAPVEPPTDEVEEPVEEPVEEVIVRDVFNGAIIEAGTQRPGLAVMIGNTSEARPQSGLSLADVVYEISVETMTITRYMAIFSSVFPSKVGPIRSVRMPFVTMLNDWDVAIAHYGGSNTGRANAMDVLETMWVPIRYDGVMAINPEYFSRDSARKAPHNAYMNVEEAAKKFPDMWPREHFVFNEEAVYDGEPATKVAINYTNSIRNGYIYDAELRRYEKYFNDRPQVDDYNDQSIYVTNIVVQYAEHSMVEKAQYVLVNFYFFGEAEYFIAGQRMKGSWYKDSPDDTTHWLDENGDPIEFLPGNTWIHVVHDKATIKYE
jgi:hypothetical protein